MAKKESSRAWLFKGNERKYLEEVLQSGFGSGTTGSMNLRFELAFAKRFKTKYALTSNSGTSTLHQALASFGVKQGDEVLLSPLTPAMCTFAIIHAGGTPVFVDIDPRTFLMDPHALEKAITSRTKAILVVHLYGLVSDMGPILRSAKKHKLFVLEDCAQCVLGTDDKGRLGGTIGDVGSFSFQSSKHLTTGDGGMLISNSEQLAERMRKVGGLGFRHIRADRRLVKKNRDLVQDPFYLRHDTLGYNYRLSELEAAVGLAQLEKVDLFVQKRKQMAREYLRVIKETRCDWLIPQYVPTGFKHAYYTFVARYTGEEKFGVSWHEFRKKYMEYGGDGMYAAWALAYNEPIMKNISASGRFFPDVPDQGKHLKGFLKNVHCPQAEKIQPTLLQFTTNQRSAQDRRVQAQALRRTIRYFESL